MRNVIRTYGVDTGNEYGVQRSVLRVSKEVHTLRCKRNSALGFPLLQYTLDIRNTIFEKKNVMTATT